MSCNGCIKFLVISFNIILLIFGLSLIGMGAVAKLAIGDYSNTLSNWQSGAPVFVIIVGVLVSLISVLGMAAACSESKCLLATFGMILILILILQFAAAIMAFMARSKMESSIKGLLEKALKKAYTKEKTGKVNTLFFDRIQDDLKCCGVTSVHDYEMIQKPIPESCCPNKISCNNNTAYNNGCSNSMKSAIGRHLLSIAVAEIVFCISTIFQIILVFSLLSRVRHYNQV